MAEKKNVKKKIVIIQLDQPEGLISIDDQKGEKIEVENWPEDGRDNIIPVGRPVEVSPKLAMRLIRSGRIDKATIQTVTVEI